MKCIKCGGVTDVTDSRFRANVKSVRRRRKCRVKTCQHKFTTYEFHTDNVKDYDIVEAIGRFTEHQKDVFRKFVISLQGK